MATWQMIASGTKWIGSAGYLGRFWKWCEKISAGWPPWLRRVVGGGVAVGSVLLLKNTSVLTTLFIPVVITAFGLFESALTSIDEMLGSSIWDSLVSVRSTLSNGGPYSSLLSFANGWVPLTELEVMLRSYLQLWLATWLAGIAFGIFRTINRGVKAIKGGIAQLAGGGGGLVGGLLRGLIGARR